MLRKTIAPGKMLVTPVVTGAARVNVHFVDSVRGVLWGCATSGSDNNRKLYRSVDGGINWTNPVSLGVRWANLANKPAEKTFTIVDGTGVLTINASVYAVGNKVRVTSTGTLPAELAEDTDYYVRNISGTPSGNSFQLATTNADATIIATYTEGYTGTLSIARQLYEHIYGITVMHGATPADDVLLVAGCNNAGAYDGTVYYSTTDITGETITLAQSEFGADQGYTGAFWSLGGCGFPSWSIDTNDDYAVMGEYSVKSTAGALNRSVWMSTDSGATWSRIWFYPGDGSDGADYLHCHMARIDPDGGCWISFGDQTRTAATQTDAAKGMWHSPGQPTVITGGVPGAANAGTFRRVYTHTEANSWAAIRPITGIFKNSEAANNLITGGKMNVDTDDNGIVNSFSSFDTAAFTAVPDLIDGGQNILASDEATAGAEVFGIWTTTPFAVTPSTAYSFRALFKCTEATNCTYDVMIQWYNGAGAAVLPNSYLVTARTAAQADYTEAASLNVTSAATAVSARLVMKVSSAAAGAVAGSLTVRNAWMNAGATLVGQEDAFVVGEDSMTTTEARTITSIRYDDFDYTPTVKANLTSAADLQTNGGIFGMCKVTGDMWVAMSTSETVQGGTSILTLLVSHDAGETWGVDSLFNMTQLGQTNNIKQICRDALHGMVWGGRSYEDAFGPGYKPVIQRRLGVRR